MKRFHFKKIVLPFVMGMTLFTLPAFAGVNYIQYQESFQVQKGMKTSDSTEGKHFQRTNKYIREQGEKTNTPTPQKGCEVNRTTNKYARCYWNPAH